MKRKANKLKHGRADALKEGEPKKQKKAKEDSSKEEGLDGDHSKQGKGKDATSKDRTKDGSLAESNHERAGEGTSAPSPVIGIIHASDHHEDVPEGALTTCNEVQAGKVPEEKLPPVIAANSTAVTTPTVNGICSDQPGTATSGGGKDPDTVLHQNHSGSLLEREDGEITAEDRVTDATGPNDTKSEATPVLIAPYQSVTDEQSGGEGPAAISMSTQTAAASLKDLAAVIVPSEQPTNGDAAQSCDLASAAVAEAVVENGANEEAGHDEVTREGLKGTHIDLSIRTTEDQPAWYCLVPLSRLDDGHLSVSSDPMTSNLLYGQYKVEGVI